MAGTARPRERTEPAPPFPIEQLRAYLEHNRKLVPPGEICDALGRLAAEVEQHFADLEGLEQHLTVLEDKMIAEARARQTEQDLLEARRALEAQLRPYRGKMSAAQIAMLEKQYLDRNLLEKAGLPRLSLFYLR